MLKILKNLKWKDWLLIFLSVGLIVVQVWLELKMPDYTVKLTTMVQKENAVMSEVWKNGGLMLLCAFGSLLSAICCSVLISNVASSFSKTLREKLFDKISSFSNAEMNKFSVPSLITRTTNDVMQLQNFMAMGVQLMFKAPIMAIWAICKISTTNIKWTMAVLISVVIIVICVGILVSICLPRFRKIQKLTDDINNVTRENITGVRVVRAFNAENYQENKFEKVNSDITNNNLFTSRAMGLMNPIMTLVMNGLNLAIYFIGAILINNIALTSEAAINERILMVGNMTAFSQYALQIVMAFMMLILIFVILPRTIVSAKRVNEVLETSSSIVFVDKINENKENNNKNNNINNNNEDKNINNNNIEIKDYKVDENSLVQGQIEFKNVCFSYTGGDKNEMTLKNISFKATKGQTLAIIGATGSAKTTLINLIPRFYDATSGTILVDDKNVKDYSEKELRNKIAIASQKAVLFKGTIKENITYGSETFDEEKLKKSIEISHSDFVNSLEKGVESEVSQNGTNFSGGQKQRLSIARAIYKDAEILIFDDTFSALDYKTDMLVRKDIHENLSDKTIIIVAQRIGTIKDADKILVLDEGKIVGMGTHEELLNSCEVYKEIALSQLSKEEL